MSTPVNLTITQLLLFNTYTSSVPSSVSNLDGTLTISPISQSVIASLNLSNVNIWTATQTISGSSTLLMLTGSNLILSSSNLFFGNNGVSTIGNGANNALSVNTHQLSSNGSIAFGCATSNGFTFNINGATKVENIICLTYLLEQL